MPAIVPRRPLARRERFVNRVSPEQYREMEIRRMERALGYPPGYARSERTKREIESEYEELAMRGMLDL